MVQEWSPDFWREKLIEKVFARPNEAAFIDFEWEPHSYLPLWFFQVRRMVKEWIGFCRRRQGFFIARCGLCRKFSGA